MANELTRTQQYENNIITEQLNKQCGLTVTSIELEKGDLFITTLELNIQLKASKKDYGYTINDLIGNHACIVSNDTMYPTNITTPSMNVFEVVCEKCQCYDECECEQQENKKEELIMNKLQAYQERINTYKAKVTQLKANKENLNIYLESGSMKQVEVDARTAYANESIEMFEERITVLETKIRAEKGTTMNLYKEVALLIADNVNEQVILNKMVEAGFDPVNVNFTIDEVINDRAWGNQSEPEIVEVDARTEYANDSIEMLEEKISEHESKIKELSTPSSNLQDQIKVEQTEFKLIRLSEMIDLYDIDEDFKEVVNNAETFEYTARTQFITLVCDYNYKEDLFNLFIFSTHDSLNLEYKASFKTFNKAESFVVKHSNEINYILSNI